VRRDGEATALAICVAALCVRARIEHIPKPLRRRVATVMPRQTLHANQAGE